MVVVIVEKYTWLVTRHLVDNQIIKFIKHSVLFCDTLSFILPKSFKKESMRKHFPREFHNICEIDLPVKNAFIIDNKPHSVPCVFQIWERRHNDLRELPVKYKPLHYKFVKKDENPDISFRRVGCMQVFHYGLWDKSSISLLCPVQWWVGSWWWKSEKNWLCWTPWI